MNLSIESVATRNDRRAFRELPFAIYAADPFWVPPLHRDINGFLDARRHPFSANGTVEFFLARRAGEVLGRIAMIENRAHNEAHAERVAFFGFFECVDDATVPEALFEHAARWAATRGLTTLRGPCSPSMNYECGLLVSGDPGPPVLMMPHNPPRYARHFEDAGFSKAMDLLAFLHEAEHTDMERWSRIASKIASRTGCGFRHLDMRRFTSEVAKIIDIYHDAWSKNWGFVPLNPAEVARMAAELKPILVPELGGFIVKDGTEVGFHLALPDYNQILISLKGRLFPLGFLKLLRARRRLHATRLLLLGVRKSFQHLGLEALLFDHIVTSSLPLGIPRCEASWILETNKAMSNSLTRAGARVYRTYRIYDRVL